MGSDQSVSRFGQKDEETLNKPEDRDEEKQNERKTWSDDTDGDEEGKWTKQMGGGQSKMNP